MRPIRQQQIHHSGVAEPGIVLERRLIAVGPPSQQMRDGIDVEIVDGLGESQHLGRDVAFLRRTTPPEYGAGQC